jgi:hypothetical protein
MAAGLFHRPGRDARDRRDDDLDRNDVEKTQRTTVIEERTTDEREATRQRGAADADAAHQPHPMTLNRPSVPPGGAVAPLPDSARDGVAARPDTQPEPAEMPAERHRRARTSFTATLGLIVGVCAVLTALSGRLAPVAIAVGTLGLVLSAIGVAAVSRKHVTGHHVALLGLLFSIGGVVLGILAINKSLPWLDSGADNVGHLRTWLDAHLPFMAGW